MKKNRILQIEKRIETIKKSLSEIGDMRPGSINPRYKDKEKKIGPYYQLSYTHEMKSRTNYIREDCLGDIREQVENYKQFKRLTNEWVSLGIEHSMLSMKLKKEQCR